ncbi:FAD-dependent oxidoreductase [Pacificimonas sp. WHA3]|uniref:FAD-dependent oxidoreductase n=1 Tax=Pacificimonas pallii TaxID=2827236 RepID=A0ABS6SGG0_9SPHN|nr:NAD(P)/FAD-dependent oxidoreductase [Pacificimonas pallii]MBV7257494.1 FAD-dependent oxidoreductase [Pacificimonas pallii]
MTQIPESRAYDVVIVGAGPAGLAAAEVLAGLGASVAIIDEQARAGGQIMRQPPRSFIIRRWLPGGLYGALKALLRRVETQEVTWLFSTTVLGIEPAEAASGFEISTLSGNTLGSVKAKRVLVAAGCHERPVPFPGSLLPGVMGAGALQGWLKGQQMLAGETVLFSGTHPFMLLVASQMIAAGASVKAVAFAQSRRDFLFGVLRRPLILLTHWRVFLTAAHSLWRIRRAGTRIFFRHRVNAAEGSAQLSEVSLTPVDHRGSGTAGAEDKRFTVDRLGLCYGFQVSSELARQAGAKVRWLEAAGGWIVDHSAAMESSLSGLYVAGEITGMAGADASRHEGTLAGLGMASSLSLNGIGKLSRVGARARRGLAREKRFAAYLNRLSALPPGLLGAMATEDSILCRCEKVTCKTVREILATHPEVTSPNALKLLSRVGMGFCQGRLCYANAAASLIAAGRVSPENLQPFEARWPVRPVPVSAIPATISDGRCT